MDNKAPEDRAPPNSNSGPCCCFSTSYPLVPQRRGLKNYLKLGHNRYTTWNGGFQKCKKSYISCIYGFYAETPMSTSLRTETLLSNNWFVVSLLIRHQHRLETLMNRVNLQTWTLAHQLKTELRLLLLVVNSLFPENDLWSAIYCILNLNNNT